MFEIDKQKFGSFVADLRKESGMTQKDLAQRLFLSDKAISKWECGSSMPDIALLVPLADILGVTTTELLECRRVGPSESIDAAEVENLVKRALNFSEESRQENAPRRGGQTIPFVVCLMIACVEVALLFILGYTPAQLTDGILTVEMLSAIFGGYFCLFAKDRIPTFYDENRLNFYSDGVFRMNLPGVVFNNSNWPHILKASQTWAMLTMVGYPLLYLAADRLFPSLWSLLALPIMLLITLGGLFIPMYAAAKKYG